MHKESTSTPCSEIEIVMKKRLKAYLLVSKKLSDNTYQIIYFIFKWPQLLKHRKMEC